jgi:hypothetical protein
VFGWASQSLLSGDQSFARRTQLLFPYGQIANVK